MTDPNAFAKLVPGFDFLQGLVKNAGASLPGVGQWIAPTINPEEIEKRIEELRTVQFWLEQNARLLGTTIQALEVQRMTLSTLKTMNVQFGDLAESLKIRLPEPAATPDAPSDEAPARAAAPDRKTPAHKAPSRKPAAAAAAPAMPFAPPGVPDPTLWWGALTKQFTELAASAMKDTAADAAKGLAGAMVKQGMDAAGETFKKAATMPMAVAKGAVAAAQGVAHGVTQSAGAARRKTVAGKTTTRKR